MALSYDQCSVLGIQLETVNGGTWEMGEFISDHPDAPPRGYMNAYEVTLGWGGAEEGGWWYAVGQPLASIPFEQEIQAQIAFNFLETKFKKEYEELPGKSSTHPDACDLRIVVEDHFAEAYPQTRPHYE